MDPQNSPAHLPGQDEFVDRCFVAGYRYGSRFVEPYEHRLDGLQQAPIEICSVGTPAPGLWVDSLEVDYVPDQPEVDVLLERAQAGVQKLLLRARPLSQGPDRI